MSIRVVQFIDTLGAGGAERQLLYLLTGIDRTRFEMHVLTIYDHGRHYQSDIEALGIPIYSLHHGELTLTNRIRALQRYRNLMRRLRPQIVHSWLHYANLIALAMFRFGMPHQLITSRREQLSPRAQWLEERMQSDEIFRIVNRNYDNKGTKHGKSKHRIIPNGIDLNTFIPTSTHLKTRKLINILMPARIDAIKKHNLLISAVARLSPQSREHLSITLIGEVSSQRIYTNIQQQIRTHQLEHCIQLKQATTDMIPYYHNSDLVILPSASEGFPNVILEAFACGIPVIASEGANKANLITQSVTGWIFSSGDTESLTAVLEAVIHTPRARLIAMGQAARQTAKQYPIEQTVAAYTQLYETLLNDA